MLRTPRTSAGNRYAAVLDAAQGKKVPVSVSSADHASPNMPPKSTVNAKPNRPVNSVKKHKHLSFLDVHDDDFETDYIDSLSHSSDTGSGPSQLHSSSPVLGPSQNEHKSAFRKSNKTLTISAEITRLEAQCKKLEFELAKSKLEKRHADLHKALAVELQAVHPSSDLTSGTTSVNTGAGNYINITSTTTPKKAKQITDFLFLTSLDSVDENGQIIDLGGGARIQLDKKKTPLSQVTVEQWGYASLGIMKELLNTGDLSPLEIDGYINYTQSIFRLSANHIWHSVLLYDKEYRDMQVKEGFKWGETQKELRDFQLVPKNNSLTMRVLNSMSKSSSNLGSGKDNIGSKPSSRKRGPFMQDGREICRKYNSGVCDFPKCRMAHNCAICYSRDHKAVEHSSNSKKENPPELNTTR